MAKSPNAVTLAGLGTTIGTQGGLARGVRTCYLRCSATGTDGSQLIVNSPILGQDWRALCASLDRLAYAKPTVVTADNAVFIGK